MPKEGICNKRDKLLVNNELPDLKQKTQMAAIYDDFACFMKLFRTRSTVKK